MLYACYPCPTFYPWLSSLERSLSSWVQVVSAPSPLAILLHRLSSALQSLDACSFDYFCSVWHLLETRCLPCRHIEANYLHPALFCSLLIYSVGTNRLVRGRIPLSRPGLADRHSCLANPASVFSLCCASACLSSFFWYRGPSSRKAQIMHVLGKR